LWLALLVLLCGYVVADFVRSPFVASSGSAAVRPAQLTLWVVGAEAGGDAGTVAQQAAASLELAGHTTVVKSLDGGTSQAVADFLARRSGSDGANLLVVTGATLADLAHDRADRLVPGASEQAAVAQALLARAEPVGALASSPLALGVPAGSTVDSGPSLLAAMRTTPWDRLVAIADDTWSRVQLAALVAHVGVSGHTRFSVFPSAADAVQGAEIGEANMVMASRGAVRGEARSGQLRTIPWPHDAGPTPRDWVALVSAPSAAPESLAASSSWIGTLSRDTSWHRALRREGRDPLVAQGRQLTALLRGWSDQAARLERLSQLVESR